MATATTIITRSLRLLGQIESGEDPSTDELTDGLEALNAMLDSWRIDALMCYARQEESLTLADGDASYTIGSGGDLNTTRPVRIEAAWIVDSNTSYGLVSMTDAEYAAIPDKTTEGDYPERFLYRPSMSTGTLIIYPVPNATRTLKLLTWVPLTALAIGDTVVLPPGWERALAFNLAIEIAPEYETQASPAVQKIADNAKSSIKRINTVPMPAVTEIAHAFYGGRSNILSGE